MSAPAPSPIRRPVSVANVKRGRLKVPYRICVHGPEGVGKTTFAADIPNAVFFDIEQGSSNLDVPRMHDPDDQPLRTYAQVIEGTESLLRDKHDWTTVIYDTADKLESMIHEHVCNRGEEKKNSIEAFGYGKGYQMALEEFRKFFRLLDELRVRRGISIVFLAHSVVRTFKNPVGEDYDRYMLRVHEKVGSFIKEWCEIVAFAQYETTFLAKSDPRARAKAKDTGARFLFTQRDAGYDAKTRYFLPKRIPLQWGAFATAIETGRGVDPKEFYDKIVANLADFRRLGGDEEQAKAIEARAREVRLDAPALARGLDYLNGLLKPLLDAEAARTSDEVVA